MKNPIKQTVYLPVKVEDEIPEIDGYYKTKEEGTSYLYNGNWFNNDKLEKPRYPIHWLKEQKVFIFTPEQLNDYTQSVIKQASVEFANWIAYTKKHGGVKPLQEALIQYKLKSTEDLFEEFLKTKNG